jgi:hypothetical protein
MKRISLPVAISIIVVSVLCMLITTGCTAAKKDAYWKSQIGVAKYDDVVARLGPPAAKETLSDKSVVAKWVRTTQSPVGWDIWTEEFVMKFSPTGILTQSSMHEY